MLNSSVDGVTAGDTGKLGELYLRHAHGAVRLAYLLTRDHGLAEDLVQDAFVRMAGRILPPSRRYGRAVVAERTRT